MMINGENFTFTCTEAAYQAQKNLSHVKDFTTITGFDAKRLARHIELRPDWDDVKLSIMKELLTIKFQQHPELRTKLKNVRANIVEENYWHDTFWGTCNGVGENHLGKLLMGIRAEL
jgi:hypothetical protein